MPALAMIYNIGLSICFKLNVYMAINTLYRSITRLQQAMLCNVFQKSSVTNYEFFVVY